MMKRIDTMLVFIIWDKRDIYSELNFKFFSDFKKIAV